MSLNFHYQKFLNRYNNFNKRKNQKFLIINNNKIDRINNNNKINRNKINRNNNFNNNNN